MFTDAEQAVLREVLAHPDEPARRLVLADMLLERGERLGELLQLENTPGPLDTARVAALREELEPLVRRALYPFARAVGFERGLPFLLQVDRERLGALEQPAVLPPRWLEVSGDAATAFGVLRQPMFAQLEALDLLRADFDSPYVHFVGDAPPAVPRLRALRHLWLAQSPPPNHWLPLVQDAFRDVERASLRGDCEALAAWLPLVPNVRCLDVRTTSRALLPQVRDELLRFVRGAPDRELRANGYLVAPEHLEEAAAVERRHEVPLSEVAQPPSSRATEVALHHFLDAGEHLAEATLEGERGLWLRLHPPRDAYLDHVHVAQAVRLAMMAPLHAHLVTVRRAVRHERDMWLRLPDGLEPFTPSPDVALAVRDAVHLGRALSALAPYLTQHASPHIDVLPVPRWSLVRDARGQLQLLVPADRPYESGADAAAWGVPAGLTPRELARGLAAVLLHWLTGRPHVVLTAPGGRYAYPDGVALERARGRVDLAGVPDPLAPLLGRALSARHEERLTLPELLAGLAPHAAA